MQSLALFDTDIDLDYSRDGGTLTGTSTGTVSIAANKLVLTAGGAKRVDWSVFRNSPITQQTDVEIYVTPNYSGTPSDYQTFFYKGNNTDSDGGRFHLSHQTNNGLYLQGIAAVTGQTVQFALMSWSPVAGTEYILRASSNWTTGNHRLWVNGILVASQTGATGTNFHGALMMRVGADWTGTNVANFSCRNLSVFDTVQYDANYTPVQPSVPNADTWPTEANTKTGITFYQSNVLKTGTYDGSDRWTDPGTSNVLEGVLYKANSTSNNRTGTLAALTLPATTDVKVGVVFDGGTGTYDGSDRWTDPGAVNVLLDVAYKANSTTNNKIGTLIAGVEVAADVPTEEFTDLEDLVMTATNRTLGRTVSYTSYGYVAKSIKGVFDNLFVSDGDRMPALKPTLRVNLSDLSAAPTKRDTVIISSVSYKVLESREDAFGGSTLILQKV